MLDFEFLQIIQKDIEFLRNMTETQNIEIDVRNNILDGLSSKISNYIETGIDFKRVCDALDITIFLTDSNAKVLYVNPAYLDKTGLMKEELIGRTIYELQEDNIFQCDVIPAVIREGKPMNAIGYVVPTDFRGFISGIPIKKDGKVEYVVTTDWDVNSIMQMENLLHSLKGGETHPWEKRATHENGETSDTVLYVCEAMKRLLSVAKTVAQTDVTVLITGETGTGKEVLASEIVRNSKRAHKPFIKVNCAAIPQELLESELFGYDEGAFTGAKKGGKKGAFEQADGGTILLDEIGELPFQVQAKLLRALQESEITRIGGQKPIKLNLRVIAATNRDLLQEIKDGRFREDLYYRLNILPLELPPLRNRKEDIPFLIVRFLEEFDEKYQRTTILEPEVLKLMSSYDWPGNIRELRNLMERLVILCLNGKITKEDVKAVLKTNETNDLGKGQTLKDALAQVEILMIKDAIRECGSKNKAAIVLGVDHSTLVRKCQKYGID